MFREMIQEEASTHIDKPVGDVFAFVDDFSTASRWLSQCVSLKQVPSGLHYTYRQGRKTGEMMGTVTARVPGDCLTLAFQDEAFDVGLDFRFYTEGGRTMLTHRINIQPKCLSMRIMSPLIAMATRRQLRKDIGKLKTLLEAR